MKTEHQFAAYSSQSPEAESATLANDVFVKLRADIIRSRLSPGVKLRLNDLRETYSVGFSPLREALSRLAENRLVISIGQRGFRVRDVSAQDIMDISMVRKEIEGFGLRLAIQNADDLWEARLVSAGEGLAALRRPGKNITEDALEERHRQFHDALISACNSPCLIHLHGILSDQFDRYRRLSSKSRLPSAPRWLVHKEILDAALARKADKAVKLLEEHITEATRLIVMGLVARESAERPARPKRKRV